MGSQRKQGFARVSFLGGFLAQYREAFLGHFLVKPLLERSAGPCSAQPALRPALNSHPCYQKTQHGEQTLSSNPHTSPPNSLNMRANIQLLSSISFWCRPVFSS